MTFAELTTLKLGGPIAQIVNASITDEAVQAVRRADRTGTEVFVLGGGSNVVAADEGFSGLVVRMATSEIRLDTATGYLRAEAGAPWDRIVALTVNEGLAGVECLSGIPGSVGGTPIQNVGAYGQEVSQTLESVEVYDREEDRCHRLHGDECDFAYRTSIFKRQPGRWVVLAASFSLRPQAESMPLAHAELAGLLDMSIGETAPLADVRAAVIRLRERKGMIVNNDDPDSCSAGSFFTNPTLSTEQFERFRADVSRRFPAGDFPSTRERPDGVQVSAAWLVERAGFGRGYAGPGGVHVSSKHSLALVNRGDGTTAQLVQLANKIVAGVGREFAIRLSPEPVLLGVEISASR